MKKCIRLNLEILIFNLKYVKISIMFCQIVETVISNIQAEETTNNDEDFNKSTSENSKAEKIPIIEDATKNNIKKKSDIAKEPICDTSENLKLFKKKFIF